MSSFLLVYLPALLLTLLIEALLAAFLAPSELRRRCVHTSLFLNLFTHPLATLLLLYANATFFLLEAMVIGIEYLGYRRLVRLSLGRTLRLAILANAATAAVGALLF